tara:strand:- start:1513 stop:1677 length:165 start_codon:yes stop_codon:yes gene_type:complete
MLNNVEMLDEELLIDLTEEFDDAFTQERVLPPNLTDKEEHEYFEGVNPRKVSSR